MPNTLSNAIAQFRVRSGLHAKQNSNAFDPTSNAQIALYLNEAQSYWAKEAVNSSSDPSKIHNNGWFLRVLPITPDNGSLWMPPDLEVLLGETDNAVEYEQLLRQNCIRPIGGSSGRAIRGGDRLVLPASETSTKYVVYNSNLNMQWVKGTVSSATSTTFTASATPSYATVPINEEFDNYYVGLRFKITSSDGSQSQIVRPTAYSASTRTFTVSAWPSFTPSDGDTWESFNRLEFDDLLIYGAMELMPQASREEQYRDTYEKRQQSFYASIQMRHGYTY